MEMLCRRQLDFIKFHNWWSRSMALKKIGVVMLIVVKQMPCKDVMQS